MLAKQFEPVKDEWHSLSRVRQGAVGDVEVKMRGIAEPTDVLIASNGLPRLPTILRL